MYLNRCVVLKLKMLNGVGSQFMMELSRISRVLFVKHRCWKFPDVTQEFTLESDASLSGLRATLLQGAQPVAFASRALTPDEGRYAQTE